MGTPVPPPVPAATLGTPVHHPIAAAALGTPVQIDRRINSGNCGPNRCLRRAVHVPQLAAARKQLVGQLARQRFTATQYLESLVSIPTSVDEHPPGGRC